MYLFFDSDVIINFLQKPKANYLANSLQDILDNKLASLLVPEQLKDELEKHVPEIAKVRKQQMRTYRKNASNLKYFFDEREAEEFERSLLLIDERKDEWDRFVDSVKSQIESLLEHEQAVLISNIPADLESASRRALSKSAPYIKNNNSIGDALILEAVLRFRKENPEGRLVFVTHNKNDYSDRECEQNIHSSLSEQFEEHKVEYSLTPIPIIEELQGKAVPESVKVNYLDYGPIVCVHSSEFPSDCVRCGSALQYTGYKMRYGNAGHVYTCIDCATEHMDVDPDY